MYKWVTTKEIMKIAGCGINKAQKIKRDIHKELMDQGYDIPNIRACPKELVEQRFGPNLKGTTE